MDHDALTAVLVPPPYRVRTAISTSDSSNNFDKKKKDLHKRETSFSSRTCLICHALHVFLIVITPLPIFNLSTPILPILV
ncbi:hypothetical protein BDR03DRAFT_111376 [Suillus americanus]|nr:hypothetical protein BDR03DRAFT_111376 [Suillus americanus]